MSRPALNAVHGNENACDETCGSWPSVLFCVMARSAVEHAVKGKGGGGR